MTGRIATAAHPLCVCGRVKRTYSTRAWVPGRVSRSGFPESLVWRWVTREDRYGRAECPMHGRAA